MSIQYFKPEEKSSFRYHFAHWCAYQMTALVLRTWKFRFLFHDIEKPWLKLFLPYTKVRLIHRHWNKHHDHYRNYKKIDWLAWVIDQESSRFTKQDAPMSAKEYFEYSITQRDIPEHIKDEMIKKIPPILEKLGLM